MTRGRLCCDARCSRHAGSVAAHCSKAAMFASARPPCRSSTRTVSLKQSSHDEISCTFTQNISRAVCAGMFLPAKAQRCIPARTVMPMTFCNAYKAAKKLCAWIKRLTQRRRHIHTNPLRIARNQRQHDNRRHIRQHAQKLTRHLHARGLQMKLQHGDPAK